MSGSMREGGEGRGATGVRREREREEAGKGWIERRMGGCVHGDESLVPEGVSGYRKRTARRLSKGRPQIEESRASTFQSKRTANIHLVAWRSRL